jgi:hypothetical protein
MSPEFLTPVATIFRLTCKRPRELSPIRFVALGGRETLKPRPASGPKPVALAKLISAPLWLFSIAFGVLSGEREQGEAVHFWQVRSLFLPGASLHGSAVNRRAKA